MALALTLTAGAWPGGAALAEGPYGAYLAGRQAVAAHDYQQISDYMTRALARDPSNPQFMEAVATASLSLGMLERALPVAHRMEAAGIASQAGRMALVAELIQTGQYGDLLARIDDDRAVGPLVDALLAGWAHLGNGAVADALAAFDALSEDGGLSGFAFYHKALALASVGDFEGAEAILAASQGGPLQGLRRAVLARATILSQLDDSAGALDLLDAAFADDTDAEVAALRARLKAEGQVPFDAITGVPDGMAEVFYTIAMALSGEARDDYTLLFARMAEILRPDHGDATLLSAQFLERLDQFELAEETYRQIAPDAPLYLVAQLGRAEALRRLDRLDEAAALLDRLTDSFPETALIHVTRGDLLRQNKDFDAAAEAYTRALALQDGDRPQDWFIYYARAISHERTGNWPEAEADFRQALALNPGQPQVLNYLGYSLVERQEKLDEALAMIEEAVAARPDSGYIVDSLGWVYFRLGRYDEAVEQMERAAELMPVDPVVNDHLGDVYWATGRKREAEFQWRRALSFHGTGDTSDDVDPDRIRRKLEVGLDQVLDEEGAPPLGSRDAD